MRIIKLNAIDSTNSYLRRLSNEENLEDYTIVTAEYQTHGKGQMGSIWSSESSRNLMFSVFKDTTKFRLEYPFLISMVTSLAVIKALQSFSISKLSIKWPNDILSEDKKICGILIENVIKQQSLGNTIIGVGLNVNQTEFINLPKASSLKLITGNVYDLEEVLYEVIKSLKYYFGILKRADYEGIKTAYEAYLFRKNKPSTFKDNKGLVFSGYIKSVTLSGNLQVLLEDEIIKEFDLKEVALMY
jgi:BirA family biotin operon repressor/biotin-[acetyl-CoA-carboxylase] ligase